MFLILSMVTVLSTGNVLTPEDAVRAALASDPALASRVAEADAARGLKNQTLFLGNNPEVEFSYTRDRSRFSSVVRQPLSITGEGIHAGRSARAGYTSARAAAERARFETAAAVRRAYARAVLARGLLRYADADRALLERLRGAAEAKLAAGVGADLDLRLSRLELARAVSAWLDAQAQASESDVELAALIGRMPGEIASDPLVAGPEALGTPSPRSDVTAARAATRAARAALARERAALFPTLNVGAFYEKDSGVETYGPSVTLDLPLWSWNQAGIGAARGNLRVAEANRLSTEARAATEEARAMERLQVAEASLQALAPDISAEADPALKSIERLFAAGETNLSETLLLRSRVVEGERAWLEARAAVAIARIEVALARQSSSLIP